MKVCFIHLAGVTQCTAQGQGADNFLNKCDVHAARSCAEIHVQRRGPVTTTGFNVFYSSCEGFENSWTFRSVPKRARAEHAT